MPVTHAVIADYGVVTAYGRGTDALCDGLMSGRTAIRPCRDMGTASLADLRVGSVPLGDADTSSSRVMRLLEELFADNAPEVPPDSALLVATTTGEVDLLEKAVLEQENARCEPLSAMLPKVQQLAGVEGPGVIVSCACASSTAALTYAFSMIRDGRAEVVLLVGVDCLSEFVLSGFASLMALDEDVARPFDRDRAGLSVGESAGYVVLMSAERAAREGTVGKGIVMGGAMTNDANHMTGPSRDGGGLARAIKKALTVSVCDPGTVAFVAAHGTGTVYNDAMEMKALRTVFSAPVPVFSIKGGIGHTMGNAGLAQTIVAMESLRSGAIPPTVGLSHPDEDAKGWASPCSQNVEGNVAVVANAGFGGVNAAVVLQATSRSNQRDQDS
jgi:3-oxoacyl-(acyl-carrier-protein) synthase